MPEHRVRQGETIESIAKAHGLLGLTVWNHPENADLRRLRGEPNILLPGDRVFVPERETKTEPGATDMRHRFRCQTRGTRLRVRFLRHGEPRADEPYVLTVDGHSERGQLDADGRMDHRVPVGAEQAVVRLGEPGSEEKFILKIGHLDPLDEHQGTAERLTNLGYPCPAAGGEEGSPVRAALCRFQEDHDLEVTGEMDAATKQKLQELYEW